MKTRTAQNVGLIGRDDWIRTSDPLNPIHRDESQVSRLVSQTYKWWRRLTTAYRTADVPDDIAFETRYHALASRLRGPHPLAYVLAAGVLLLLWIVLPWLSVLVSAGAVTVSGE